MMRRIRPKQLFRERPTEFVLAAVILVVCATVAVYQYRAQDSSAASAMQEAAPEGESGAHQSGSGWGLPG